MVTDNSKRAFDVLWEAYESGRTIPCIPPDVRPRTREQGYAVQRHFADQTSAVLGWKIAATSLAGQTHIGVDGPLAGRVLAERFVDAGGTIPLAGNSMHLAELELAFQMSTDFSPREQEYSLEEVLEGTGELLLSLEIPSTRLDDVASAGAAQLIADNACASHLAVKPPADRDWKPSELAALPVRATSSSGLVHEGSGSRVLGDPTVALTWLVNELSRYGITLEAGQLVTTGTCIQPMPIQPGDTVTGDYGRFGTIQVSFD